MYNSQHSVSRPARLVYWTPKPSSGPSNNNSPPEAPPPLKQPPKPDTQLRIDTEPAANQPPKKAAATEKKEVAPAKPSEFTILRAQMAMAVKRAMGIANSFSGQMKEKYIDTQLKPLILTGLKNLFRHKEHLGDIPKKLMADKITNAQHVYTFDLGTHLAEIELKAINESNMETLVNIYKKDRALKEEDKKAYVHDVPGEDLNKFLEFKAKAIGDFEKLGYGKRNRAEIANLGKKILAVTAIKEIMANAKYISHHLLSLRLDDGEYVDIRLYHTLVKDEKTQEPKVDRWDIVVMPFKKPAPVAPKTPKKDTPAGQPSKREPIPFVPPP